MQYVLRRATHSRVLSLAATAAFTFFIGLALGSCAWIGRDVVSGMVSVLQSKRSVEVCHVMLFARACCDTRLILCRGEIDMLAGSKELQQVFLSEARLISTWSAPVSSAHDIASTAQAVLAFSFGSPGETLVDAFRQCPGQTIAS